MIGILTDCCGVASSDATRSKLNVDVKLCLINIEELIFQCHSMIKADKVLEEKKAKLASYESKVVESVKIENLKTWIRNTEEYLKIEKQQMNEKIKSDFEFVNKMITEVFVRLTSLNQNTPEQSDKSSTEPKK